ncbi:hypothetical protein [Streptomyces sp. NPDC058613]|uniref:hypothetical protein n=1 Tax=unclassified Streptomyces TaxID=2593676 RepID=UPI0036695D7A
MADQPSTSEEQTATGNAKGPAPLQLSQEQKEALGLLPANETTPGSIATLSLRQVDGRPVLAVSGGTVIPRRLAVVDETGNPITVRTSSVEARMNLVFDLGGGTFDVSSLDFERDVLDIGDSEGFLGSTDTDGVVSDS